MSIFTAICRNILVSSDCWNRTSQTCGLDNRNVFSHGPGAGKSELNVPSDSSSGETALLSCLCPHVASASCTQVELFGVSSSYEDTGLIRLGPHPDQLIPP